MFYIIIIINADKQYTCKRSFIAASVTHQMHTLMTNKYYRGDLNTEQNRWETLKFSKDTVPVQDRC